MNIDLFIVTIYAYIFGSIPFGLLITKLFLKEDVRNIGSGNIGATNVLRTGKKSLAALTLFFDIFKGYISILITTTFFFDYVYLAGLLCLIGHIFPIWLKFKGGKGVATYLGLILAFSFKLSIIFAFIWITAIFITKYSSLSSIISTISVFIFSLFYQGLSLNIFLFNAAVLIIFTHRQNIIRLKNKSENKIKI